MLSGGNLFSQCIMARFLPFFFIVVCFFIGPIDAKWRQIKNSQGIKVYEQKASNGSLLIFKGTGIIQKELFYVLAVLADVEKTHEWVESVRKVKILKKVSDVEMITYSIAKAPWPLQDRDTVARGWVEFDHKNKWVHVHSRSIKYGAKPPTSKYVRVPFMKARWSFKPIRNGTATWAEFTVQADPGGVIPNWVVNWVSQNVPYNSIKKLRKRIKQEKFNQEFVKRNKAYLYKWVPTRKP